MEEHEDTPRPSVFEDLAFRREHAPRIEKRMPLAPEEISRREGVELSELEGKMKERAVEWAQWAEKNRITPSKEDYAGFIDELYGLYRYATETKELPNDLAWTQYIKRFETFCSHFCMTAATKDAKKGMMGNLRTFVERLQHPQRILELHPREYEWGGDKQWVHEGQKEIYEADGDWVLLPYVYSSFSGDSYTFTDASVVREIIELLKSGYHSPDYSHATGSAALGAIGGSGAILSAREAVKRGAKPKTGEYATYMDYQGEGLRSVYANQGHPQYGYHGVNWFNEFFVGFGINKERQERALDEAGFNYAKEGEPKQLSQDWGSEGVVIGNAVPLDAIDNVYYWKKYEREMEEWTAKNCSQAKPVSLEAVEILGSHGNFMNEAALREGVAPVEMWEKLLRQK